MNLRGLVKSLLLVCALILVSCEGDKKESVEATKIEVVKKPHIEFGYNFDDYKVVQDTIRNGDSFGQILERNKLGYAKVLEIAKESKGVYDIRRVQVGKPYTILCSKDSIGLPEVFVYQPNGEVYYVFDFKDSIKVHRKQKPIIYKEKTASGIIYSSISETLDEQGLSPVLAFQMSDIYAWTISFVKLQEGDRFKVIYEDKYIDDSVYVGVHKIKAAYFEHKKEPFYAFEYETDKEKGIVDYFSEDAKNLRRAFLKGPIALGRISSRYNLKRRIALYGNRVRPHKGTDFAAPVGTPILATANGTVTKSGYTSGNGNYVKIKHNTTYSTQYLHMRKRKVKRGDFVKQGDVIGWVGMTGNTSGPHVCYRFWKNGRQVDPFKQKLPEAKPMKTELKNKFFKYIETIKEQLDSVKYKYKEGTIKSIDNFSS